MSEYPEKTCDITKLVRHPKLVAAALEGRKTQQRRAGVYAYPGELFELKGVSFELIALRHETLADMGDAEAVAEGYPNLDAYKQLILRMHKGMDWEPTDLVWMHEFKIVQPES